MNFFSILLLSLILKKSVLAFSDVFIYEDAFSKPPFQIYFSDQFLNEKEVEILERETKNEIIKMVSKENNEHYICEIPKVKKKKENFVRSSVKTTLSLLEPMKNKCLYHTSGWWNYEFCYGKSIRQYHIAGKNEPARYNSNYILGKYTKYLELSSGTTEETKELVRINPTGKNYFTQKFIDGTKCDKTNIPRTTEVKYYCGIEENIIYVKETTTCNYEVAISTNRLCKDPVFNPQINNPLNSILCYLYKTNDDESNDSLTSDDYLYDDDDDDEDQTYYEKLSEIHKKYNKENMKKASDVFKNKYMKSINFKNKKVLVNPFFKSDSDEDGSDLLTKESIKEFNRKLMNLINNDDDSKENSEINEDEVKLIMNKLRKLNWNNDELNEEAVTQIINKLKKIKSDIEAEDEEENSNLHLSESSTKKLILNRALNDNEIVNRKFDDPSTKHVLLEKATKQDEDEEKENKKEK